MKEAGEQSKEGGAKSFNPVIDGNAFAEQILAQCRHFLQTVSADRPPQLALVRVGDDPASLSYLKRKDQAAAQVGVISQTVALPETVSKAALFACLEELNKDPTVHAILVQTPLPAHLNAAEVFNAIAPHKDADGFQASNLGRLLQGDLNGLLPCTPLGIRHLLRMAGVQTAGQHVVVVGRSLIVSKPLGLLLLERGPWGDATLSFAHSQTPHLAAFTRQADILIVAAGKAHLIGVEHIKRGVVVIDVGVNRVPDPQKRTGFRLVGDVDFQAVLPYVRHITPVPGGVGPMTVAFLIYNTVRAWVQQEYPHHPVFSLKMPTN